MSHRAPEIKAIVLIGIMAGFLCAAFAQTYTGEASSRVTINLGETPWKYQKGDFFTGTPNARDSAYNDASWSDVGIPHCFNATDTWRNVQTGIPSDCYRGTVWYRKHFMIDAAYAGRKIELEFQGVNIGCAVYVNGTLKPGISAVAQPGEVTHVNGHLPFVVDITDDVTVGAENVIAVRVSNSQSGSSFFTPSGIGDFIGFGMGLGGINRPVYLHVTDKVHVPLNVYSNIKRWGTYLGTTAATDAGASIRIQTNVYNDDTQGKAVTLITKIVDAQKNVVTTLTSSAQTIAANTNHVFDQTATITNPHLWYPNNNAKGGPYLYKVYHIVQVGDATVDVFESPLGIRTITWDNDYPYINGEKHMFWGFGSRYEYPALGSAVPEEQLWRDVKLVADCGGSLLRPGHVPAAPATVEACDAYGVCLFENTMDNEWSIKGQPALTYKDEFHRDCIIRDRNHPSIAAWELNNGCAHTIDQTPGLIKKLIDTIKVLDDIAPRAASTRDTTDYLPSPSELVVGKVWSFQKKFQNLPTWGAESWMMSNARYSYDYEVKFTDRFIVETISVGQGKGFGYAHWMLMECGGEDYADFQDATIVKAQRKTLGASAVDHNRIPKLVYNVYKNALWVPYARRPGVALQSHWNYSAGNRTVIAYSNCPSVELFVNGVSKGVKVPNANTTKCQWTDVAWEPGTLRAEGRDASGAMVCFDERKTAGAPSTIVLTVEPAIVRPDDGEVFRIRANGTDAAFILATVVDAEGNWCPLATNNITFSVSGQGTYVGSSNYIADLSKPDSYHAPGDPELAAEGGMMKVAVRSSFTPGPVTVEAAAAGLAGGSVTFTTLGLTPVLKPPVATLQPSIFNPGSKTFKIIGTSFIVPNEFGGKAVSIKMYDLSGRLLRDDVVKTKRVSFAKYGLNASGIYVVRCREVRPAADK